MRSRDFAIFEPPREDLSLVSAGRPTQSSTSQHVDVEMCHRLSAVSTVIDYEPIAIVGKTEGAGDSPCQANDVDPKCAILSLGRIDRIDVIARHDQNVRWSLRIDIAKGDCARRLSYDRRGYRAGDDSAEQAAIYGWPSSLCRDRRSRRKSPPWPRSRPFPRVGGAARC